MNNFQSIKIINRLFFKNEIKEMTNELFFYSYKNYIKDLIPIIRKYENLIEKLSTFYTR